MLVYFYIAISFLAKCILHVRGVFASTVSHVEVLLILVPLMIVPYVVINITHNCIVIAISVTSL